MFDYLVELWTKPHMYRSPLDDILMALTLLIAIAIGTGCGLLVMWVHDKWTRR